MKYNYYEVLKIENILHQMAIYDAKRIKDVRIIFEELSDILGYYFPVPGKMLSYTYKDYKFYNKEVLIKFHKENNDSSDFLVSLYRLENNNLYKDSFCIKNSNEIRYGVVYSKSEFLSLDSLICDNSDQVIENLLGEIENNYVVADDINTYALVHNTNGEIWFSYSNNNQNMVSYSRKIDCGIHKDAGDKISFKKLFSYMDWNKNDCEKRVKIFQKAIDEKKKK